MVRLDLALICTYAKRAFILDFHGGCLRSESPAPAAASKPPATPASPAPAARLYASDHIRRTRWWGRWMARSILPAKWMGF